MATRGDSKAIAYSAAAIYAGAALVGLVEWGIPGGPSYSALPGIVAVAFAPFVAFFGRRIPRRYIVLLGPLGAALITYAVCSNDGYTDAAVLYMWPAVWMAYFFGTGGTIFIVCFIALSHGIGLALMPGDRGNLDRWIDVVGAIVVVAAVVRALAVRNERLVARLAAEAREDPLTGLLNRRGFHERMEVELARAARDRTELAVVEFDIDHFKRTNDEFGHEIGDRVLTLLGTTLAEEVRGADIVARVGGEEFLVVLPRTSAAAARAFAERVRGALADVPDAVRCRFGVPEGLTITVSAGVASAVGDIDEDALIEAADRAMYAAKRGGRNQVVVGTD